MELTNGTHVIFPEPHKKFGAGATLYGAGPREKTPTNYKKIGLLQLFPSTTYNTNIAAIYKAKDCYVYSIYQDGCFYPYYGKIVFDEPIKED